MSVDAAEARPSNEEDDKHRLKSSLKLVVRILKTISVEPAGLLLMTSTLMSYLVFQNMLIENICLVSRNNSPEICKEIVKVNETFSDEEVKIQEVFAETKIYRSILDNSFPILFVIFMGPWSDHYGRKLPLLLSTFGYAVQNLLYLIFSYHIQTFNPYWLNVIVTLPKSFTGGDPAFAMAAYSYITDMSTDSVRTVRTGLLNAALLLGVPTGFWLGGLVVKHQLSYATSFAISGSMCIASLLIILVLVKNKGNVGKDEPLEKPSCWTVINPKNNFFKVIALPFKKRQGSGRIKIFLLLITMICSTAPIHGEFGVFYLFLRSRLKWNAEDYGNFSSFNWFIGVAGVALSIGIFSKWLKFRDPVVGFLSGISQGIGCFVYAFAGTPWLIYLASTVDMCNGTMVVIARSMLSKLVRADEIGKLFSMLAVLESLIPLAMDPLYSLVYRATLNYFVGAFFFVSAAFTIPPQLIYLWFIIKGKMTSNKLDEEEDPDQLEKDADSKPEKIETSHANLGYSSASLNMQD